MMEAVKSEMNQSRDDFDFYQFLARLSVIACLIALLVAIFSDRLPVSSHDGHLRSDQFLRLGFLVAFLIGPCAILSLVQRRPKLLYFAATGILLYIILTIAVLFLPLGTKESGVSIWMQHHPRYGMNGYPSTCGRNWSRPDFDVMYCFDRQGSRRTTDDRHGGSPILLLGCSFTFGTGVENDQTFASRLAQETWPNQRVVNAAFPSWGTTFAFGADRLSRARQAQGGPLLLIEDHSKRNGLRASWHENLVGRFVIPISNSEMVNRSSWGMSRSRQPLGRTRPRLTSESMT